MVKGKHQQVSSNMWYSNVKKTIIYIHLHNILQTIANTERCNHSSTFFIFTFLNHDTNTA